MSDVTIPEERKRRWKMDAIAETVRQNVDAATDGWSAEQLRAKLAEVLTQVEPIRYTLWHIANNPDGPHSGMAISSQLFPEQLDEDYQGQGPWTTAWDKDLKKSVPVAFTWDGAPPERAHWQTAEFPGGVNPGPSFNILEVWQYATASSIFCGSFGTDDVLALNEACRLPAIRSSHEGENMVERPTTLEIEVTLAETWRKWGGWPAVESGMINMTGVLAQAVIDLYARTALSQPNDEGEGK